jgi:hypothetical protein
VPLRQIIRQATSRWGEGIGFADFGDGKKHEARRPITVVKGATVKES